MLTGALTACDVMLTIRPNLRAIMPSIVAFISSIGASMLASSALIQSSRLQFRKSPAGGPPALLIRISGSGQAARIAPRPSAVVTSAAIATGSMPVAASISSAARCRTSGRRATITSFTPSPPSASAQLLPSPMLAAQTIAVRPRNPNSMLVAPIAAYGGGPHRLRYSLIHRPVGSAMPAGLEPHMHKLDGSNPNCRG